VPAEEIVSGLGTAEQLVEAHSRSIQARVRLRGRTQAALYAGRVGLVPLDQPGSGGCADEDRQGKVH